jgi:circadian clock protein KaiC
MSTIADTVILLRYVEIYGEIHRGIAVLKMRGSGHDKEIREFTVDASGMHVGDSFRNISGIISGQVHCGGPGDGERIGMLSPEERCLHN